MLTHYTGQRGENCRNSTMAMQFVRPLLSENEIDDLYIYGKGKIGQTQFNTRDAIGVSATEEFNIHALEESEFLLIEVPMQF